MESHCIVTATSEIDFFFLVTWADKHKVKIHSDGSNEIQYSSLMFGAFMVN
jgi:hypothetical protein